MIIILDLIQKSASTLNEIKKTFNLLEIIKFKSQRKKFFILTYVWWASGFCFYGLILNLEHLGGNIFTDSIVTFTGEIISELVSGYFADEFGRVAVLKFSGFMGGIGFILYEMIDQPTIKTILVFMTSFGFSATFNVIYIYSPEAFPTSIRSTVMGFLYLISRLGALVVPTISSLFKHVAIIFGIISIVSSYLCFGLSETLGHEIQDDIPELQRKGSFLSSSKKLSKRQLSTVSKLSKFSKHSIKKSIVSDFYFKIEEY